MSKRLRHFRPAIAMVELIFAIVIMGIVLSAAPSLIATAVSSTSVALQQEGINEASARVTLILTYAWDKNDTNDSCTPPILHVTDGDDQLEKNTTTGRRNGVPKESNSHSFSCNGEEFDASTILNDPDEDGNQDDIDDFVGITSLVIDNAGDGGKDYLEQDTVEVNTTVFYIADEANYDQQSFAYTPSALGSTGTSNIKEIQVILTSSSDADELQKEITLHAFSCNVGGFSYEHRSF